MSLNLGRGPTRLGLSVMLLMLVGCNAPKTSDRDLVTIDVQEAPAVVAGKVNLFGQGGKAGAWVDPRTEEHFRKGHIPGAIHMPFTNVRDWHKELDGYKVLVVYGDGYRDMIAEGMAKRLIELGHDDVRVLRGGLEAWTSAGNPLETD